MVYDGARWVANQVLRVFTRSASSGTTSINPASRRSGSGWKSHAPWLWTSVIRIVLDQPVFAVLGVLGILLMLLFRPRKPLIGYSRN